MDKRVYCITHEAWVFDLVGFMDKLSDCVFAACPPPELEKDWELNLSEPAPDELKRMDISGLELAAQFIQ
jgi:hypothetical protein